MILERRLLRQSHSKSYCRCMMRKMQHWLKKFTPNRETLEKHRLLQPFSAFFNYPTCWTFHRRSVIRAFAVGLLIAFIPPIPLLPVHLVVGALCGIVFRLNLPVLFATVFISNPFTWLPQLVGSIWVGARLLGVDLTPFLNELSHRTIWAHLNQLWAPLFLGALVLGLTTAALGYFLAKCLWRVRVSYQWRRRQRKWH